MPFPSLTVPPTAPDRTSGTFSTQADAFVAWWATVIPQLNDFATYGNGLSLVTGTYQFGDGAVGTPGISFASDTDTGFFRVAANTIGVSAGGVQVGQVNSGGVLRWSAQGAVGSYPAAASGSIQVQGLAAAAGYTAHRVSADSVGARVHMSKSRGTTAGDTTIVVSGDELGSYSFWGADGTTIIQSAQFRAIVTGTPAAGDVRAKINVMIATAAGAGTTTFTFDTDGSATSIHPTGGVGYSTGAGGTVTQATSRTTGVTLNKVCGAITLFSAAGSTTAATFTVTNSAVAATDVVTVCQKSGTNLYNAIVTAVAAGSFNVTFYTTGGTATDAPVFNFAVTKAVTA